MTRSSSAKRAFSGWTTRLWLAGLLRRLASWISPPLPSRPWKPLAKQYRHQRDTLLVRNTKQKQLLLWLLGQIAQEAQAAEILEAEQASDWGGRKRGQA